MPTSTFTHLLSSADSSFNVVVFTAAETIKNIRDGEPRTANSTFTHLLSSEILQLSSVLLYVHRP